MERVTAGVLAAVMALGMTGCANGGMSGTTTDLTGQYGTKEDGKMEGTGANGQSGQTGQAEDAGAVKGSKARSVCARRASQRTFSGQKIGTGIFLCTE